MDFQCQVCNEFMPDKSFRVQGARTKTCQTCRDKIRRAKESKRALAVYYAKRKLLIKDGKMLDPVVRAASQTLRGLISAEKRAIYFLQRKLRENAPATGRGAFREALIAQHQHRLSVYEQAFVRMKDEFKKLKITRPWRYYVDQLLDEEKDNAETKD